MASSSHFVSMFKRSCICYQNDVRTSELHDVAIMSTDQFYTGMNKVKRPFRIVSLAEWNNKQKRRLINVSGTRTIKSLLWKGCLYITCVYDLFDVVEKYCN